MTSPSPWNSNFEHFLSRFYAVSLVAFSLTWSKASLAESKLSIDAGANFPQDATGVERGWGAGLRLGHEWDLLLIALTPEVGVDYHSFRGSADADTLRLVGGGRLSVGAIIKPGVFFHAGLHRSTYFGDSQTSMAYDGGLALDFTLLPVVDFGVHAAWISLRGGDELESLSWLAAGAHVSFSL